MKPYKVQVTRCVLEEAWIEVEAENWVCAADEAEEKAERGECQWSFWKVLEGGEIEVEEVQGKDDEV